jgi:hypothetical protein
MRPDMARLDMQWRWMFLDIRSGRFQKWFVSLSELPCGRHDWLYGVDGPSKPGIVRAFDMQRGRFLLVAFRHGRDCRDALDDARGLLFVIRLTEGQRRSDAAS